MEIVEVGLEEVWMVSMENPPAGAWGWEGGSGGEDVDLYFHGIELVVSRLLR